MTLRSILIPTLLIASGAAHGAGLTALDLRGGGGPDSWQIATAIAADIGGDASLRFGLGYANGAVAEGHILAEALLAPTEAGRLALWARYTDLDNDPRAYGAFGAAFAIAPDSGGWLTLGGEIGGANFAGLDWVGVHGSYWRSVTPDVAIGVEAALTEIDEPFLHTWLWQAGLTAEWRPKDSRLGLYGALGIDGLAGQDAAPAMTTVSLGLRWHLGAPTCLDPAPDVLAPLFRRGIF